MPFDLEANADKVIRIGQLCSAEFMTDAMVTNAALAITQLGLPLDSVILTVHPHYLDIAKRMMELNTVQ